MRYQPTHYSYELLLIIMNLLQPIYILYSIYYSPNSKQALEKRQSTRLNITN